MGCCCCKEDKKSKFYQDSDGDKAGDEDLGPENAFYDEEGNCFVWDDPEHTGFTDVNTVHHYTRDDVEVTLFWDDNDPNTCMDIGQQEQSIFAPSENGTYADAVQSFQVGDERLISANFEDQRKETINASVAATSERKLTAPYDTYGQSQQVAREYQNYTGGQSGYPPESQQQTQATGLTAPIQSIQPQTTVPTAYPPEHYAEVDYHQEEQYYDENAEEDLGLAQLFEGAEGDEGGDGGGGGGEGGGGDDKKDKKSKKDGGKEKGRGRSERGRSRGRGRDGRTRGRSGTRGGDGRTRGRDGRTRGQTPQRSGSRQPSRGERGRSTSRSGLPARGGRGRGGGREFRRRHCVKRVPPKRPPPKHAFKRPSRSRRSGGSRRRSRSKSKGRKGGGKRR